MSKVSKQEPQLPEKVAAIAKRGFVMWKGETLKPEFRAHFDPNQIPVVGIRHVRVWDIQVDDERALQTRAILDSERGSVGNTPTSEGRHDVRSGLNPGRARSRLVHIASRTPRNLQRIESIGGP